MTNDFTADVRHALKQLGRSREFALVAVLCLGLGIGVNTAIFGMLNSILFRHLAVINPEQMVSISRGRITTFSYPVYQEFQARSQTLAGLTASLPLESDLDVDGESEFVTAELVTANYGEVFGVRPVIGRWFTGDAEPMAVISYAAWQRRFGGSPTVVGQRIRSESQSYTIVGVTPREFTGVLAPLRTDVWIPVRTRPVVTARLDDRRVRRLTLFGRMKDGIGAAQVAAELNGIDAQLRAEHGMQTDREPPIITEEVRGVPHPGNRRSYQSVATLLTGVVGMVLLIACVNVGNLLLVRGAARQREFALRGALGATRFRLAQQLFAESLVLALAGGVTGLLLAVWTSRLLERSVPPTVVPIQLDLALDWRVVVYALAISLVTTLLCGILPAGRLSRFSDGLLTVRGDAAGELSSRKPIGLVAQVVVSLVLLLVAGSFIESLFRLQTTDPGFKVDGRLYAYTFLSLPPFTPESGREFYSRAIERLEALPGVRSAALTRVLPLTPSGSSCVARPDGSSIPITTAAVSAGFFETMGIDIVAGRSFESDSVSVDTVIVNETLARRLWPSGAAIGERVMIGCEKATSAVVSGVARNSAVRSLGEGVQPHIYVPFAQQYSGGLTTILVETSMPAPTMVDPVRRALLGQGQGIRVYAVRPLEEHVHESYWPIRWEASVLAAFGLLGLVLAAIGLYGVIAYRVALRTREIGVRMALGASREEIFRHVLGQGLRIVVLAVVIGELLAAVLMRAVGSLQTGVRPAELSTHLATIAIWVVIALLACYWPAARATRVDPLVALRTE